MHIWERTGIGHAALELSTNYRMEFSRYKHPGFAEEGEWRLVLNSWPDGQEIKAGNMTFSEPKYRVANGKLISYRELCCGKTIRNEENVISA